MFHDYLYRNTITVKSDNNLLAYMLTSAQLDVMEHWQVASLASYNFNVQYKVGKKNIEVDALSHINWSNSISSESTQAILNTAIEGMSPLAEIYAHSTWAYLSAMEAGNDPRTISVKDWAKAQRADLDVNEVIKLYQERCLNIVKLADYEIKGPKVSIKAKTKTAIKKCCPVS